MADHLLRRVYLNACSEWQQNLVKRVAEQRHSTLILLAAWCG